MSSSKIIELRFYGEPAPQGSKTVTRWGAIREVSKKIQPWRASIQYACQVQYKGPVITGPVSLEVVFVMPRSKGHWSKSIKKNGQLLPSAPVEHTKTPDVDKLLRGVLDPLTIRCGGCVLEDDSIVVSVQASKRYQRAREEVGAFVTIKVL